MDISDAVKSKTATSNSRKRRSDCETNGNTKIPKLQGTIWNGFSVDDKDENYAICDVCDKRVKRRDKASDEFGTSNMVLHFATRHKALNFKTYKKKNETKKALKKFCLSIQAKLDERNTPSAESLTRTKEPNGLEEISLGSITETKEIKSRERRDEDINQDCSESIKKDEDCQLPEKELGVKETLKPSIVSIEAVQKSPEEQLCHNVEGIRSNKIDEKHYPEANISEESTMTIQTPEFDYQSDLEIENDEEQPVNTQQTAWQASVKMENVAEFLITAQEINGKTCDWIVNLPKSVTVVGVVGHEETMKYIEEVQRFNSMDITVIKLTPANDKDRNSLMDLYTYLKSRKYLGVVNDLSESIKQFYLMPCLGEVPPVLQSIIVGGTIEKNWSTFILGIIIRTNKDSNTQGVASGAQGMAQLGGYLYNGWEQMSYFHNPYFAGPSSYG